jgi:hypothetical protein
MTHLMAALLPDEWAASAPRQRIVIGRTQAGLPRTYRLARRSVWPARLMAVFAGLSGLL